MGHTAFNCTICGTSRCQLPFAQGLADVIDETPDKTTEQLIAALNALLERTKDDPGHLELTGGVPLANRDGKLSESAIDNLIKSIESTAPGVKVISCSPTANGKVDMVVEMPRELAERLGYLEK